MDKKVFIVFIMLGFVSLFADIVYEGARSALGNYLYILGASAIIVSLIGVAEFLGYVMRFVSGFLASLYKSSKILWTTTIAGYVIQLVAVPLLALVNRWDLALILIFLERLAKGLRTPTRDVIIAEVATSVGGRGKGFGIHELLDQVGAIAGPIIFAVTLMTRGWGYAFLILSVPGAIAVALVIVSYVLYPEVKSFREESSLTIKGFSKTFYLYLTSIAFLSIGFVHWGIISYHLGMYISGELIALAYSIAMLSDAIIAIPIGIVYDRIGIRSLMLAPIMAAIMPLMLFTNTVLSTIIVACLWGVVIAVYETIMRAAVADLAPGRMRPMAYGLFSLTYGVSWAIGSIIIGYLYTIDLYTMTIFIISSEALSMLLLYATTR